jgi:heme-degrading monooxygenase HmoA
MSSISTPYYAVIFTSTKKPTTEGYEAMAEKMFALAQKQPGYIGVETSQTKDGNGVTISYWHTEEAIKSWKANAAHLEAQREGRNSWYENYRVRICKVERDYSF